jgi:hypothetical protein
MALYFEDGEMFDKIPINKTFMMVNKQSGVRVQKVISRIFFRCTCFCEHFCKHYDGLEVSLFSSRWCNTSVGVDPSGCAAI